MLRCRKALLNRRARRILASCPERLEDVGDASWMLAEAARRVVGGDLFVVRHKVSALFVALRLGQRFLGLDGWVSGDELLTEVRAHHCLFGDLALLPFDGRYAGQLPYDEGVVARLEATLRGL